MILNFISEVLVKTKLQSASQGQQNKTAPTHSVLKGEKHFAKKAWTDKGKELK